MAPLMKRYMDCEECAELLPWLLNGTLDDSERSGVLAHLAGCGSCRQELAETAVAWKLLDQHIPSLELAEYSQGAAVSESPSRRIENHLKICPSCREELDMAVSDRVVDLSERRADRTRSLQGWGLKALASAAAVGALVVSGSFWLSTRSEAPTVKNSMRFVGEIATEDRDTVVENVASLDPNQLFRDGFESGAADSWPADRNADPETYSSTN